MLSFGDKFFEIIENHPPLYDKTSKPATFRGKNAWDESDNHKNCKDKSEEKDDDMLATFKHVTPYFKVKEVKTDNLIFRLHYRWTFLFLIISTVLVTSRQYIGEHIKCIEHSGKLGPVIETFCFFTTTFTLVRHYNITALDAGIIPHPGIGPKEYHEDKIKRHAYYQWVPFVLFGQAIMFYFPHFLWKLKEGGRIKWLVNGLRVVKLTKYYDDENMNIGNVKILTKKERESRISSLKIAFKSQLQVNKNWGPSLISCECLNLLHVLLQIYATNLFLGGLFYQLGIDVLKEEWNRNMDSLDVIFPKVTKCVFHKFGPSGSIQNHDVLCIMALNVINEKIYTFLWFWFLILLVLSILALLWRILTLFLHKISSFNHFVFSYASPGRINQADMEVVTKNCDFSDWLFLYFFASNLSGHIFREVLSQLAEEFRKGNCIKKKNTGNHYKFNTKNENSILEDDENMDEEKFLTKHLEKPNKIDTVDSGNK